MLEHLWTVVIFALVFVPVEHVFAARRAATLSGERLLTHAAYILINPLVITTGFGLIMVAANLTIEGQHGAASWPLWLQVIAAIVIGDLGIWIAHRLSHKIPLLWRFHRIHHSADSLTWLTAYRVHPVDQMWDLAWQVFPALLLGFSAKALLIYGFFYGWYSLLLHANIRLNYGSLGRIFSNPQFHHWHHALESDAYDKNFAALFCLWDRLFGTAYTPPGELPQGYGVENPPRENYLIHLAEPFLPQRGASQPSTA